MPELSKFQAETLHGHLNPSDPDNMTPEQELYANDPALRAYAEEQLGVFTQGPGAMADQFISGAVDASKGVLGLGFDLLAGMAPEGSDFERGMMDRSEEIRMARTAAEDALQVRRAETIGEQGPFIEAMTGQAPYASRSYDATTYDSVQLGGGWRRCYGCRQRRRAACRPCRRDVLGRSAGWNLVGCHRRSGCERLT
jgi:hypothetical protein